MGNIALLSTARKGALHLLFSWTDILGAFYTRIVLFPCPWSPLSFTRFVVLGIRLSLLPSCPVLVHVFFPTLNIPRSPCPPLFVFHFLIASFSSACVLDFVTRAIRSFDRGIIKPRKRYANWNWDNKANSVDLIKPSKLCPSSCN